MVPAQAEVQLQFLVVVVVQVGTHHLPCVQTATVPPARILLLIVEVSKEHDARLVGKTAGHAARGIALLRAAGKVEIGHISSVHAFLDAEVEHGLLLSVFDAGDACLVALLVVELQVLDDAHGDVLQGSLHVAEHELLAVEQYLLHLLAVDGDVAILVYFCTGNTLDEFLDGRALRRAEGLGVIHDGVLSHDDLCGPSGDDGLFQHGGFRLQEQAAQVLTLVASQRHLALQRLVAHGRDAEAERAGAWGLHVEVSLLVAHRSSGEGTV